MNRRSFLAGLSALAAPAIIRTPGLLMPIKPWSITDEQWIGIDGRQIFKVGDYISGHGIPDGSRITMISITVPQIYYGGNRPKLASIMRG